MLQIQSGHFDVSRFIEMVISVAVVFIPLWFSNRKDNKTKHEQNIKRFDYLINEAIERPHHSHEEKSGNLTASGIRFGPRKIDFNGK